MERLFGLSKSGTSVGIEVGAGLTTFMAMAYIAFVNPQMMANTGMDQGASFVATCLAAAIACLFMGLYANWPIGLAPGMGLNAFFTYTIVGDMGYSWQTALGAVFIAGILFVLLTVTRLREWMLVSIPWNLRIAMGAGIGLFVGLIGLKNGGIIIDHPATLLALGDFKVVETGLAGLSFLIITSLAVRQFPGAILIGILAVTGMGLLLDVVHYQGIVSMPPSIEPVLGQLDIVAALDTAMVSAIASILFVNLFDTAGTLVGVASQAGLANPEGEIKNLDKALVADSTSSVAGALIGCAPVTSYVESAAGVAAGGRTGLTACTVGMLFLALIFFAPLAGMIPPFATAGALLYVALLMMSGLERLDWRDHTESLPALLIIVMVPLSFSIANGIAAGFLSYVILKVAAGKPGQVSVAAWFMAAIFTARFVLI
ncbi:NCS2 family permease [Luminiphilus sp.]|jgi:AGZA family xanthine/uracil permease-like MFS transporter|nr:NCS2 family permease [Halieaceae bacterium]MDA8619250.1 NCS2 family permease [Luminiphilus sp.]MDC6472551.1 NCS2 family permease [Luminiphilus sp.]